MEVDRKVSTIGFFTFAFALDPPEKERAKVVQGFFFHLTQSIKKLPPQKKNQIDLVLLVKRNMKEKKLIKKEVKRLMLLNEGEDELALRLISLPSLMTFPCRDLI